MARLYVCNATAASASNAAKTAIQLATSTTATCKVVAFDISFDGADATKTPIVITLEKPTAAGSGGAAFTPLTLGPDAVAAASVTTPRTNDTTPGTGNVVYYRWAVPPTSGFSYQFPLGRELSMRVSEFLELKVTTVTASGTPTYHATLTFEE